MRPEHKALGEYYFHGKTIDESAKSAGLDSSELEKLVQDINKKSIPALQEFYAKGGSHGYIADKYGLNRNELYAFMSRHKLNKNYEDEESKIKIMALAETQNLPLSTFRLFFERV